MFLSWVDFPSLSYALWVEDIGSNIGFFMNMGNTQSIGGLGILLCCEEDGEYIYRDTVFNTCYFESEY